MGSAPPVHDVQYHAAFEDEQGLYIEPRPFDDWREALKWVEDKNLEEVNRITAGKEPDTLWFVLKAEVRYTVSRRPKLPEQTDPRPIKTVERKREIRRVVVQRKRKKRMT